MLKRGQGVCALKASLSTVTTAQYLPMLLRKQQALAVRLHALAMDDNEMYSLFFPECGKRKQRVGRRVAELVSCLLSSDLRDVPVGVVDMLAWVAPWGVAERVERWLSAEEIVDVYELPATETLAHLAPCGEGNDESSRRAETLLGLGQHEIDELHGVRLCTDKFDGSETLPICTTSPPAVFTYSASRCYPAVPAVPVVPVYQCIQPNTTFWVVTIPVNCGGFAWNGTAAPNGHGGISWVGCAPQAAWAPIATESSF